MPIDIADVEHLKVFQRHILATLYVARRPLTTKEIAEKSGIAWETARDNLSILYKRGYIYGKREGNRIYWWLK